MSIQIKRGLEENLPTLQAGEPAFTTDTKSLFIGTGTENIEIGSGSGGDQTYTHTQSVPETEWVVILPEGFKRYPSVTITDSAGTQVYGDVDYDESAGTVTLTFSAAFGGKAHFN